MTEACGEVGKNRSGKLKRSWSASDCSIGIGSRERERRAEESPHPRTCSTHISQLQLQRNNCANKPRSEILSFISILAKNLLWFNRMYLPFYCVYLLDVSGCIRIYDDKNKNIDSLPYINLGSENILRKCNK